MPHFYSLRADSVWYDVIQPFEPESYAMFSLIALRQDKTERRQRFLELTRELIEDGDFLTPSGPVGLEVDGGYHSSAGITSVVLTRHTLDVKLAERAAKRLDADLVRVDLNLGTEQYATLKQQLTLMFTALNKLIVADTESE
jgi:hypothetical protein